MAQELPEKARNPLAKTSMCKFHARNRCREGINCQFAHNVDELCRAPDLTKTTLCSYWKRGCCPFESAACSFAHGYEDLQFQHKFNETNNFSYAQYADPSASKTNPFKEPVSLIEDMNFPNAEQYRKVKICALLHSMELNDLLRLRHMLRERGLMNFECSQQPCIIKSQCPLTTRATDECVPLVCGYRSHLASSSIGASDSQNWKPVVDPGRGDPSHGRQQQIIQEVEEGNSADSNARKSLKLPSASCEDYLSSAKAGPRDYEECSSVIPQVSRRRSCLTNPKQMASLIAKCPPNPDLEKFVEVPQGQTIEKVASSTSTGSGGQASSACRLQRPNKSSFSDSNDRESLERLKMRLEKKLQEPVPQVETVEKMVEVPQVQAFERTIPQVSVQEVVAPVPNEVQQEVVRQVLVPQVATVEEIVEVIQAQPIEKTVPVPKVTAQEVLRQLPRVQRQGLSDMESEPSAISKTCATGSVPPSFATGASMGSTCQFNSLCIDVHRKCAPFHYSVNISMGQFAGTIIKGDVSNRCTSKRNMTRETDGVLQSKPLGKEIDHFVYDSLFEKEHALGRPSCAKSKSMKTCESSKIVDTEKARETTTIMISCLPYSLPRDALVQTIDALNFSGAYNLLYMPTVANSRGERSNRGYAFVNFLTAEKATEFASAFEGYSFKDGADEKVVVVARPAALQAYVSCSSP